MSTSGAGSGDAGGYRIPLLFHPTQFVVSLEETADWFERVFGRASVPLSAGQMRSSPGSGYPNDYCIFTEIQDVLLDAIDPKRLVIQGKQRYKTVDQPHLHTLGWWADGMAELFREMKRHGIRILNQHDELMEGDDPPESAGSSGVLLFFPHPEDAGLHYEFLQYFPYELDKRTKPGWSLPPVAADDPLGIIQCSHHTILTDRPERALRLMVDILHGEVIGQGRDELRGTTCTYVRLADTTLEYAVPDPGTAAHADWQTRVPLDTYHSITWQVADLDKAERHLTSQGVGIALRSDDTIVADPASSAQLPFGFTTTLLPADPRA
jgi:hypothetical protein